VSCSNYVGYSVTLDLVCFFASQELAAARNHVFLEEIIYGYFRSWHTSEIVDFGLYAMAVVKLKEAV